MINWRADGQGWKHVVEHFVEVRGLKIIRLSGWYCGADRLQVTDYYFIPLLLDGLVMFSYTFDCNMFRCM